MNSQGFHTEVLQIRGDRYRIIIKGKSKEVVEKCNHLNISIPDNRNLRVYEPSNLVI